MEFIKFLEAELKVSQQKILIMGKATDQSSTSKDKRPGNYFNDCDSSSTDRRSRDSSPIESSDRRSRDSTTSSECVICGEADHVQTNGPAGMKLIQYFVCKKFVDMKQFKFSHVFRDRGAAEQEKRTKFECLNSGMNN